MIKKEKIVMLQWQEVKELDLDTKDLKEHF